MNKMSSDSRSPNRPVIATRFLEDATGSTAIEYALIASFVGAVIAGGVFALGGNVFGLFQSVGSLWPS